MPLDERALIDLLPIAHACRDVGGILVVDATQSLGAMPSPLADVEPDFLVAAGYKWLLFPHGVSLFYASPRWRDARPLEETWQARENARDFARLVEYSDVYMPGALPAHRRCQPAGWRHGADAR